MISNKISSLWFTALLLFFTQAVTAAENDTVKVKNVKNFHSIAFNYNPGQVIRTHAFVKGENPSHDPYTFFHSFSLKYAIHTTGAKLWQQIYAYPIWGIGLYKCYFANDHDQLGNPASIFLFLELPLKRKQSWSLNWEMEFGFAFNWNRHQWFENHYNYPIGTNSTVYIKGGLNASFKLCKNLDLNAGFCFTHFSNGAVRLPNLGLNMAGPELELKYIFNKRTQFIKQTIPTYLKEWEYIALLAPSMKQLGFNYITETGDTNTVVYSYGILSFSTGINRQISHKIKFGAGVDITYNSSHGADIILKNGEPEKAPFQSTDKILLGAYASFEIVVNKLALVMQPGLYIYKKELKGYQTPLTYQRIGLKYHLWDHLLIGMNVRAFSFTKADFIEWIVGYRIKWQKSYRSGNNR